MPSPVGSRDALPYTPYEPDENVCRDAPVLDENVAAGVVDVVNARGGPVDPADHQDADYVTISAGAGAIIGADVSLTLDRHGHLYLGLSAGVGVSATVASAALMGGELANVPSGQPTETELRSFLEGDSVGASMSAVAAGGVTNSAGGTAWERGVGLVQAGAHFQHTWHLTEVPIRW